MGLDDSLSEGESIDFGESSDDEEEEGEVITYGDVNGLLHEFLASANFIDCYIPIFIQELREEYEFKWVANTFFCLL